MPGCPTKRLALRGLVVTSMVLMVTWCVVEWYDTQTLHRHLQDWEGFGPEKGVYNFTVVTGLFDIGRGWWLTQPRTYNTYLSYLLQVLKLDVNMIVFIEPKGANFVRHARQGREHRTLVVETGLADLPCYNDLPRVQDIMASQEFQTDNENWKRGKVEATVPLYNLVTNSKAGLVQRAVGLNPSSPPTLSGWMRDWATGCPVSSHPTECGTHVICCLYLTA